eukprot:1154495-Pelagomonas_calceolata.AAC.2
MHARAYYRVSDNGLISNEKKQSYLQAKPPMLVPQQKEARSAGYDTLPAGPTFCILEGYVTQLCWEGLPACYTGFYLYFQCSSGRGVAEGEVAHSKRRRV